MAAPTSTTNTSRTVKKVGSGKENAPPPRKVRAEMDDEDDLDQMSEDDEGGKRITSRPVSVSKGKPLSSKRGDDEDVQRKLSAVTAERDRLRTQRDTFSKQFEELSKTRSTDIEGLFEKYKSKAETASKTQNEIIANQTALTEKLQAKVQALEKALAASKDSLPSAGGPFEATSSASVKADPKEIRALKEELGKTKVESASKDQKIAELQREYKAEVEHSRSLQASTKNALSSSTTTTGTKAISQTTSAVSLTPEEAEKDAASLALYEDLTMLNIINVKIKPGKYNTKESTFNCVLAMNEKSLNFKLRCFTDIDRTADKPTYVKTVHYTPELLENESQAFVKRLDYFASQFVVPRDQLGGFLAELRLKLELDEEE